MKLPCMVWVEGIIKKAFMGENRREEPSVCLSHLLKVLGIFTPNTTSKREGKR
jgi:hypothetical protein